MSNAGGASGQSCDAGTSGGSSGKSSQSKRTMPASRSTVVRVTSKRTTSPIALGMSSKPMIRASDCTSGRAIRAIMHRTYGRSWPPKLARSPVSLERIVPTRSIPITSRAHYFARVNFSGTVGVSWVLSNHTPTRRAQHAAHGMNSRLHSYATIKLLALGAAPPHLGRSLSDRSSSQFVTSHRAKWLVPADRFCLKIRRTPRPCYWPDAAATLDDPAERWYIAHELVIPAQRAILLV